MELTFDAVIRKFESELQSVGHSSNYEIALATLGLIAETRDVSSSAIEHTNFCLSKLYPARLRQIIVLGGSRTPGYQLQIGQFGLREFDPKNLLYWAKRCKCGYPNSLTHLTGCFSIEHTPFETKLIDWEQLSSLKRMFDRWGETLWINSIMDIYYQAITVFYQGKVPSLMKEQLKVLEAGALTNFDVDTVLNSYFARNINLFQWEKSTGRGGWALMTSRHVAHMNFVPPSLFTSCVKWLNSGLGFKSLSDKKFDKAIASYCRFLQRAHDHRLKQNIDEAFLHFIIALDLMFGIEGRSTVAVCSRAALLVHRQLNQSLDKQSKNLKRLYDTRSKYVHEGRKVKICELEEAEIICSQVLWALLAASGLGEIDDIDVFLKQIDFIISAISAEKEITEDEFKKIGIPCEGHRRVPPNRIIS